MVNQLAVVGSEVKPPHAFAAASGADRRKCASTIIRPNMLASGESSEYASRRT
jgi:hypothetical protein